MSDIFSDLQKCVGSVTNKWAKQRRAEKKNARAFASREYMYSSRIAFTDVARRIIPEAYRIASGGGTLPASKRQIYYAAREKFRQATGRMIEQKTCDGLLLKYMNRHRQETAEWKVTADPRGSLVVPNTFKEVRVPCGTLQIDSHMAMIRMMPDGHADAMPSVPIEWPSMAPGQRYRAVLYIEKEGFEPLLQSVRLAERFEIAVLSCKGMSVVAARKFVDHVCRVNGGVPLYTVHDFDLSGFFIAARLTTVSDEAELQDRVAYRFKNQINETDFGLRLDDAIRYQLADERCKAPGYIDPSLRLTPQEAHFLKSGRRIELNAFTAPQFIEWIEGKLRDAGLTERMLPTEDVLGRAYRQAIVTSIVNEGIQKIHAAATITARATSIPENLAEIVRDEMRTRDNPWDVAVYRVAERLSTQAIEPILKVKRSRKRPPAP